MFWNLFAVKSVITIRNYFNFFKTFQTGNDLSTGCVMDAYLVFILQLFTVGSFFILWTMIDKKCFLFAYLSRNVGSQIQKNSQRETEITNEIQ